MSIPGQIATGLSLWIDSVASSASAWLERARGTRQIAAAEDGQGFVTLRLVPRSEDKKSKEDELPECRLLFAGNSASGEIPQQWAAAIKGAKVSLVLHASRFIFRPLELPGRAVEFLDGIIRAQIDRLTPWNPADVVFHWTRPQPAADDHIALTVVATARTAVASFAQALLDLGAGAVEISTTAPDMEPVTVHTERIGGQAGSNRVRRTLTAVLATSGLLAMLSVGIGGFVTDSYDAEQQQIQRRIAERRALARGGQGNGGSAIEILARLKQTTPSAVMVIDELSGLLPDHTYVTELRIEGDKLQITGLTHDAPSLIQILEQSAHFSGAGFSAPTTRAANEPGERFHIEARIKRQFGSGT